MEGNCYIDFYEVIMGINKKITKAQEKAITHKDGPMLVLAGPGSGKTFVITERVKYLIEEHLVNSQNILIITFTKAAALEMEHRFHELLPGQYPKFGTFHSLFYNILRNSYKNFPSRFITNDEKKRLVGQIVSERMSDESEIEIDIEEALKSLSLYMNQGLKSEGITESLDINPEQLSEIYNSYHQRLMKERMLDFDDILVMCADLLRNNINIRKNYIKQFQYILIDECQDMNRVQYEIIKLLTSKEKNVFMVGDDDQSIYRFRGAKVGIMQEFTKEYTPVLKIELDINFRSTTHIVNSSQKVIAINKNRFAKNVTANSKVATGVYMEAFNSKIQMHNKVFSYCKAKPMEELSDIAIIYRTNQELQAMAYKLRREKIPYITKEDDKSIFDSEWYRDVEAYFYLATGNRDKKYVVRIGNRPNRFLKREQLLNFSFLPDVLLQAIVHLKSMKPYLAFKYLLRGIGYLKWLERQYDCKIEEYEAILEQIAEVEEDLKSFDSIREWLEFVEIDRLEQQENIKKSKNISKNEVGIRLLTMHASKGLEFETVFLLDLNQGKMPKGTDLNIEELEEERRLFYVAMTRAKGQLYLLYLNSIEGNTIKPSIFISPLLEE